MSKEVIIICGATASGKTYFAHNIAKKYDGEIVCADSMQLYKHIPIITASPPQSLKSELPYWLYNFLNLEDECSYAHYAELAAERIKEIISRGKMPIVVGGSGMYISALIFGYNDIPKISDDIRKQAKALQNRLGQIEFFEQLKIIDPISASRLNMLDKQRSIRAYEVFKQTGMSILAFQNAEKIMPLKGLKIKTIMLHPNRYFLYSTCDARLSNLFLNGAVDEVRAIYDRAKILDNSAVKSVGIQEIMAYLKGTISLNEALKIGQSKTRQLAKRQVTWFKNQIKEKTIIEYNSLEELESFKLFV
jgi:tRNA dimethylallyltransferase